jgi:hypothetical protein
MSGSIIEVYSPGESAVAQAARAARAVAEGAAAVAQAAVNDVEAAVATTTAAVLTPGAAEDQTQGYKAFSRILDTDRLVVHECVDPAEGAAAWVRRGLSPELPRRQGQARYYCAPATSTTTSAPTTGRLFLRPMILHERHQLIGVAVRSAAALGVGANTGMKASIYASREARPFGAPIAADDLGVALGTNSTYDSLLAGLLNPGAVWIGVEFTDQFDALGPVEALPNVLCSNPNDWTVPGQMGLLSLANQGPQGFSIAKAWSAPPPTFAAGFDWDAVGLVTGVPIPFLRLA